MEVSAKTGYQVEDSFKKNADLLLNKIEKGIIDTKNDVHLRLIQCPGVKVGNAVVGDKPIKIDTKSLNKNDIKKKKGCC